MGRRGGIAKDANAKKETDASSSQTLAKVGGIVEGEENDSGDEAVSAVGAWNKKGKKSETDDRKGSDIVDDDELPVTHEVRIPSFDKPMTALGFDPAGSRMVC